jgi:ATP-dependent Clp protease ATP-binding subunit ClpC
VTNVDDYDDPGDATGTEWLNSPQWITGVGGADKVFIVGRDDEIRRLGEVLASSKFNNALLVGSPGSGRTAIVQGFCQRAAEGEPDDRWQPVVAVDARRGLVEETLKDGPRFAARLERLMGVASNHRTTLFFPDITLLLESRSRWHEVTAATVILSWLERGLVQIIGTATPQQLRPAIAAHPRFFGRFTQIQVTEPTPAEAVEFLAPHICRFASRHRILYSQDAVTAAVELSAQHLSGEPLLVSAERLLDQAGAIKAGERATEFRMSSVVTANDISDLMADRTGLPVMSLDRTAAQRLIGLEDRLRQSIVGQDEAVAVVTTAVKRARAGLSHPGRPNGSFLFAGPTGVGKTEIAKALARELFDDEAALVRIDCSEFREYHTISRLIGPPLGYRDSEQGGQLTEAVKRQPHSVVLFDEFEKAHPDVHKLLLQILDEGRLVDGRGVTAKFNHTYVILTSNIGARPDGHPSSDDEPLRNRVQSAVRSSLPPELVNRLDHIVVFEPLSPASTRQIAGLMVEAEKRRIFGNNGIRLVVADPVLDMLALEAHDTEMGARPLRRLIEQKVLTAVADRIIEGAAGKGATITVSLRPDNLWDDAPLQVTVTQPETKRNRSKPSYGAAGSHVRPARPSDAGLENRPDMGRG